MSKALKNKIYSQQSYGDFVKYERVQFKLNSLNLKNCKSVLDLGGGKGQALVALRSHGFDGHYTCVDSDSLLIQEGAAYFNDDTCVFLKQDCLDFLRLDTAQYDLIICWGLLSFFDNLEEFLDLVIERLTETGTLSLWGGFCLNDIDVFVKYRRSDGQLQTGLNMFGLDNIKRYITQKGYNYSINRFEPVQNRPPDPNNPLVSWNIKDIDGNQIFLNGLNVVRRFHHLVIKRL